MSDLFTDLMETMDAFDLAVKHAKGDEATMTGLKLVRKKLENTMNNIGLKRIQVKIGDKFDVNIHDAVESVPGKKDTVTEVVKSGYTIDYKTAHHQLVELFALIAIHFNNSKSKK